MLWISLFLPELSLQSHARGAMASLQAVPLVISDGNASRLQVYAANACARAAGISPPMPVAAAQSCVAGLLVVPRAVEKERQALVEIANWLSQFSPMVCGEPAGASLEISTTLRLFGGIGKLAGRIRHGLVALGYRVTLGIAPTPLAAWLLAQAAHYRRGVRMCREPAQLEERLADIPVALFAWPREISEPLAALGLVKIRHLLAQPRAGIGRRFGEEVLRDLDRAMGRTGDPREPHRLPESFTSATDLLFDIIDADRLMVPIRMLLAQMEGFLRGRGTGVTELVLELKHNRTLRTTHRFGSRHPLRSAEQWARLVSERLAAHPLPDAVLALRLDAPVLLPFQQQNESWLPTGDERNEKWHALAGRIVSRLGERSLFMVSEYSDHRPELAWQAGEHSVASPARRLSTLARAASPARPRPLLLLAEPQALVTLDGAPQHHGPLSLVAGPERIESGWWDGRPVTRDYYVARNPQGEICWVFRDYRQQRRWYLHGYFA